MPRFKVPDFFQQTGWIPIKSESPVVNIHNGRHLFSRHVVDDNFPLRQPVPDRLDTAGTASTRGNNDNFIPYLANVANRFLNPIHRFVRNVGGSLPTTFIRIDHSVEIEDNVQDSTPLYA